ncbi:MAG: hypothetical protein ACTSQJ_14775 [Promethearchaeota archaeon]
MIENNCCCFLLLPILFIDFKLTSRCKFKEKEKLLEIKDILELKEII